MKRIILIMGLLYLTKLLYSQTDSITSDSLIKFNDLIFNTPSEEAAFKTILGPSDLYHLNLALYANPDALAQSTEWYIERYYSLVDKILARNFNSLKPEKQIKLIYTLVHEEILKQYSLNTTFDKIFENGIYNCVTGTILLGLILEHFNISFDVKETTNHVFLVAKTSTNPNVLLEVTDPNKGYISYTQAYKDQFVQYLVKSKLLSSTDLARLGSDSAFNKFFFPKDNINLSELVGLQYFNNGIEFLQSLNNKDGLNQLQKSYYLYPCEKTKYLIIQTLGLLLNNATYFDSCDWHYFILVSRFNNGILNNENLKDEFNRLTYKVLIDKSNLQKYDEAYQYIYNGTWDTVLQKEIAFIYNYQLGRYFYVMKRMNEAFPYIEIAYNINPDNYEVQTMFVESFFTYLETLTKEEAIVKLENIEDSNGKLKDNPQIFMLITALYLDMTLNLYEHEKWLEGDAYLDKFEVKMIENPYNLSLSSMAEDVYTRVATHYFKLNKKEKARSYILRGLKYYPDSYRLNQALEELE
jgi:hypothetical protein